MVTVTQKTSIKMNLTATGETHARTRVRVRDVESVVDEPAARGGTNLGPSPTETLMASLIGCTNVISHRIAERMGVRMGEMDVRLSADFDRRGVTLEEEIERPFSNIEMQVEVDTDATPEQLQTIRADLQRFCPIAKLIRGSGVTITETWTVRS